MDIVNLKETMHTTHKFKARWVSVGHHGVTLSFIPRRVFRLKELLLMLLTGHF